MAKIHVVIPVYNVERYLRDCVYSVLNQPYKEIDIVLVDDGSPDHSGLICDEISAAEDRVFAVHQNNKGLPGARNTGIEFFLQNGVSEDDYFAFLDSDDIWMRDSVSDKVFEEAKDADIIIFPFCFANEDMTRIRLSPLNKYGMIEKTETLTLWDFPVFVWNRFYRVSLIKQNAIMFQEELKYGEDTCFNNVILYYARNYYCNNVFLTCYRFNSKSIMNTYGKMRCLPWIQQINGLLSGLSYYRITDEKHRKKTLDYCCWYMLEFAESHYMSLALDDMPYTYLETLPFCDIYLENNVSLAKREKCRIDLMVNHKSLFKFKFFTKGLILWVRKKLKSIKWVRALYEKKHFPISI